MGKRIRRYLKRMIIVGLIVLLIGGISPMALRLYTSLRYDRQQYTVDSAPTKRYAVVFGARVLRSGRLSTMLYDRVRTAAELYQAGKVEYILLTGDGHEVGYNEPQAMRRVLLEMGIPDSALVLDEWGLRTYDSCYRAYHEYAIQEAILITQAFHLDRALMLCEEMGMDVVGVAADYHRPNGYRDGTMRWLAMREIGATALAYWDVVRGYEPSP